MRVRFFGTRGSVATPGPHTLRYGGNTSCTEVQSSAGTLVILDMGTGATVLGRELMARERRWRAGQQHHRQIATLERLPVPGVRKAANQALSKVNS